MNKQLGERYQTAEERAEVAEAEVQSASQSRLTELMKLPPLQRLRQLDDPLLTSQDRLKLRNSIETKLKNPSWRRYIKFPRRWAFRRILGYLRYAPAFTILSAIVFPVVGLTYVAWKNTDDVVPLSLPLDVVWTLPNGTEERKVMDAGHNLAVRRWTNTSAVARRWIEKVGYATAKVHTQ